MSSKRLEELQKKIYELEHNKDKIGMFEPQLIPLYREYQKLCRKVKK